MPNHMWPTDSQVPSLDSPSSATFGPISVTLLFESPQLKVIVTPDSQLASINTRAPTLPKLMYPTQLVLVRPGSTSSCNMPMINCISTLRASDPAGKGLAAPGSIPTKHLGNVSIECEFDSRLDVPVQCCNSRTTSRFHGHQYHRAIGRCRWQYLLGCCHTLPLDLQSSSTHSLYWPYGFGQHTSLLAHITYRCSTLAFATIYSWANV